MSVFGHNLLILVKGRSISGQEHEEEAIALYQILLTTITEEKFCRVTELVNRNGITSDQGKIRQHARGIHLRPFRFLINKN